jgi:hypothetical protein
MTSGLPPNKEAFSGSVGSLIGGGSIIDFGEEREARRLVLFNRSFKSRDGFFLRILTGLSYQAVVGCMCGSRSRADRERTRQARRDGIFEAHKDSNVLLVSLDRTQRPARGFKAQYIIGGRRGESSNQILGVHR